MAHFIIFEGVLAHVPWFSCVYNVFILCKFDVEQCNHSLFILLVMNV